MQCFFSRTKYRNAVPTWCGWDTKTMYNSALCLEKRCRNAVPMRSGWKKALVVCNIKTIVKKKIIFSIEKIWNSIIVNDNLYLLSINWSERRQNRPEKQSILLASVHLLARFLEILPLFLAAARPMNVEWKMRPYLGVLPLVFNALCTLNSVLRSISWRKFPSLFFQSRFQTGEKEVLNKKFFYQKYLQVPLKFFINVHHKCSFQSYITVASSLSSIF